MNKTHACHERRRMRQHGSSLEESLAIWMNYYKHLLESKLEVFVSYLNLTVSQSSAPSLRICDCSPLHRPAADPTHPFMDLFARELEGRKMAKAKSRADDKLVIEILSKLKIPFSHGWVLLLTLHWISLALYPIALRLPRITHLSPLTFRATLVTSNALITRHSPGRVTT